MKFAFKNFFRNILIVVIAAVLPLGCATSGSKQTAQSASAQSASAQSAPGRTVILVPIVIVSPTNDVPTGSGPETPLNFGPPVSIDRPTIQPTNRPADL